MHRSKRMGLGAILLLCGAAGAAYSFPSTWTSEEGAPSICNLHPAIKAECAGDFCDAMRLICADSQPLKFDGNQRGCLSVTKNNVWSKCGPNSYVTGIACQGSFCSTISIECTRAFANALHCYTSESTGAFQLSEEVGGVLRTVASVAIAHASG